MNIDIPREFYVMAIKVAYSILGKAGAVATLFLIWYWTGTTQALQGLASKSGVDPFLSGYVTSFLNTKTLPPSTHELMPLLWEFLRLQNLSFQDHPVPVGWLVANLVQNREEVLQRVLPYARSKEFREYLTSWVHQNDFAFLQDIKTYLAHLQVPLEWLHAVSETDGINCLMLHGLTPQSLDDFRKLLQAPVPVLNLEPVTVEEPVTVVQEPQTGRSAYSMRSQAPGESGLVFVAFRDPLSVITRAVTKQEYSDVGIYFTTLVRGRPERKVLIWKAPFSSESLTLDQLARDPRVAKIAVAKLQEPFEGASSKFRKSVVSALKEMKRSEGGYLRYTLLQMLGMQTGNEGITSLDFVNKVMDKGGFEVDPKWAVSTKTLREMDEMAVAPSTPLDALTLLAGRMTSSPQGRTLVSFLLPNPTFSEAEELSVETPDRVPEVSSEVLEQACAMFIRLLLKDPQFSDAVLESLRMGQEHHATCHRVLSELLEEQMRLGFELEAILQPNINSNPKAKGISKRMHEIGNEMRLLTCDPSQRNL